MVETWGNMGKLWEIQKKSLAGSQNVDMYQRILFFNGVLYTCDDMNLTSDIYHAFTCH